MERVSRIGQVLWEVFSKVVCWIVRSFLQLFHKELTEKQWESFIQFLKFGIVGLSNTLISYVINVLVLLLLGALNAFPNKDYLIANMVAFVLSVAWSFYWNNKYVFQLEDGEKRNIAMALFKAYLSYGFSGIILCNILSYVWIEVLHVSKYIAPLINLIVSVPINFFMNKFWAFKDDHGE